jgi:hypothetical protein
MRGPMVWTHGLRDLTLINKQTTLILDYVPYVTKVITMN